MHCPHMETCKCTGQAGGQRSASRRLNGWWWKGQGDKQVCPAPWCNDKRFCWWGRMHNGNPHDSQMPTICEDMSCLLILNWQAVRWNVGVLHAHTHLYTPHTWPHLCAPPCLRPSAHGVTGCQTDAMPCFHVAHAIHTFQPCHTAQLCRVLTNCVSVHQRSVLLAA
jgi:hypothetical protein